MSNPLLPALTVAPWDNPHGEVARIRPPFFAIDTKGMEGVPNSAVIICSEGQGRQFIAYDEDIVNYINELAALVEQIPHSSEEA